MKLILTYPGGHVFQLILSREYPFKAPWLLFKSERRLDDYRDFLEEVVGEWRLDMYLADVILSVPNMRARVAALADPSPLGRFYPGHLYDFYELTSTTMPVVQA